MSKTWGLPWVGLLVLCTMLGGGEGRMINVTFTKNQGSYALQSAGWPQNAPASTNTIWELNSPPGTRIKLSCDDIRLLKRKGCTEGSVTFWDGSSQLNLCNVIAQFERESVRNKMFVQFRTGWFGVGRFRCLAQVVQPEGFQEFEDSNENAGQGGGIRDTSCPCGWTNKRRIVGGRETGVNEYIFPVNIKFPGDLQGFCGGSIITRRHILTAAHCLHGLLDRQFQVVVGEHDFRTVHETDVTEVINVQSIIMHENYDHEEMTNDIALLVLARDIQFSQFVGPVCLPAERYDLVGRPVKVLGWGRTSTNGNFSSYLQEVTIQVVPLSNCRDRYSNHIDLRNPNQICTFAQNRDSCQGDSGGPVIYHDDEIGRYVQVGLVSYGKDCASDDPAVNIDVYAFYDWIQQNIARYRPRVDTCEKV